MVKILLPDNLRGMLALVLSCLFTCSIKYFLDEGVLRFVLSLLISTICVCVTGYFIVFPKLQRNEISCVIKDFMTRFISKKTNNYL